MSRGGAPTRRPGHSGFPVHSFLLDVLQDEDRDSAPGADWPLVISQARSHALIPLLYAWLNRAEERAAAAGPWLHEVRRECFGIAARNAVLAQTLRTLLLQLQQAGVPCVPLRGVALAERLHGPATPRPMGDIDLLVRRADLGRVREILVAAGYREVDRRRGFAEAYSYTLEFYSEGVAAVVVEPHWTIAYPPASGRVDMDGVWARCTPGTVLGVDCLSLAAEDLLLHLVLHAAHAGSPAPLLWFYEIGRLVRLERDTLAWPGFASSARQAGVERPVRDVLLRVRDVLGAPVPESVLTDLAARSGTGGLAQQVAETTADGRESLALFFGLPGWRAKLRYALAVLFPSREFMKIHYGLRSGSRLPIAYLRRASRFTLEVGKAFLSLTLRRAGISGVSR